MPYVSVDGVNLYYEVTGEGYPLVWAHEFAGDYRSWEAQVRFFSRRYQVITFNARGYPPSDVPADVAAYSQEQAVEDLRALLAHLSIQQAHVGGLSMGGSLALHFGLTHPQMCRSLIVAAAGSGSVGAERWKAEAEENAKAFRHRGHERGGRRLRHWPSPHPVQAQGPQGLAGIPRPSCGALLCRRSPHLPWCPDKEAVPLRSQGPDE